jgi:hypothetical protein
MKPQHPRRWPVWALAGLLAFGVGGLTARPATAKPGFGTVSDDDRAKQKAEQEKRAEERRHQEKARETERQADRDRQTQERARQERQSESERRTQREQVERDRTARDSQRERDRQAERERETQARAERERAAREAQARTDRERAARETQARAERARADRESQARASREREAQEPAAAREARARDEQRRAAERPRPGFGRRPTEAPHRDTTPATQPAHEPRDRTPESPAESQPTRPQPGFGLRSETHRPTRTSRPEETRSQPPPTTPGPPAVTEPRDRTPDRQGESSPTRRRPGFGTRPETTHPQPSDRPGPGRLREDQGEPDRRGSRASRLPENANEDSRQQKIPFGVRRPIQTTHRGSLDRYFNPRGGNIGYHLGSDHDRYRRDRLAYRHDHRYHHYQRYDCPYDVIYAPPPVVVYEPPRTDVVVIPVPERLPERDDIEEPRYREPEPELERPESPSRQLARASTLDEVIGDVEEAWLTGNLQLLMQHVREDHPLEVYREGEFTSALSWEQFRDRTREAFERYETLTMRFAAPRMLSETEAVVSAEHRFREGGGEERRVRVVYALTKERGTWWIAGLDYLLLERPEPRPGARQPPRRLGTRGGGEGRPHPAVARPRAAAPTLSQVTLVKAQPIRWASLRSQARPTLLATLRGVSGGRAALYDLKAMRGIHPGTLAWALYRRGQTRPLETGILEPRSLPAAAWVTVKLWRRPATSTTTMARLTSPSRPDTRGFSIRALGTAPRLTLAETRPASGNRR